MPASFLLWGYASFRAGRSGTKFLAGVWCAIWSAMVTMTLAVCAGTLLEFFLAPYPLEPMRQWAEFQRSGWNDPRFLHRQHHRRHSHPSDHGPVISFVFGSTAFAFSRTKNRPFVS